MNAIRHGGSANPLDAARQHLVDPARLVFIDETWTKTNMAPLRGWAPGRTLLDVPAANNPGAETLENVSAMREKRRQERVRANAASQGKE